MPANFITRLSGALVFCCAPVLACPSVTQKAAEYLAASKRVHALPEVEAWQQYIAAHPPARAALDITPTVQQVKVGGQCYTPVTLYSDEETHFHRWKTFLVGPGTSNILVENEEGIPVPLSTMRSNPSIEGTASSGLRPPPAAPHVKR
jgi:hypothetical protein